MTQLRRVAVVLGAMAAFALASCGDPAYEPAATVAPVIVQPAAPVASPMPVGVPVAMAIPKLGVVDEVIPVGLADGNAMEVPPVDKVGWYRLAPKPGERGAAVIAGHRNWSGTPGSFARLDALKPGDRLTVVDDRAVMRTFEVYDVRTVLKVDYQRDTVPLVFGARATNDLVLVTCGGDLAGNQYLANVVASARLASLPVVTGRIH